MYQQRAEVSSYTELAIVDPEGKRVVLGGIYKHRDPLLNALFGRWHKWRLERKIAAHNARTEKLNG